ncbi:MAG: hypothetical protein H7A37_06535 [Chlamydiales bacterium]|nr:hypothetical protein [Chlamydiia bacterium]MCP5507939.1 hypothetical protein [Chlamydiales bacterium]
MGHKILLTLTLFPACLLGSVAWEGGNGRGFSAVIDVSGAAVGVEQKLAVTIVLTAPQGYRANRDLMRRNLLSYNGLGPAPFVLMSEEVVEQEHNIQRLIYTLDPEYPGDFLLSFKDILYEAEDGKGDPVTLYTGVFPIEVTMPTVTDSYPGKIAALLPLNTKLPITMDAKNKLKWEDDPERLESQAKANVFLLREHTFPWSWLALATLIGMLYWLMKKRRQQVKLPYHTVKTAKAKAMERLQTLRSEQLPENGCFEAYYIRLTDTVRQYIEEGFGMHAPTMTTQEFLRECIKAKQFNKETVDSLKRFLERADKVKFARYSPSVNECDLAQGAARQFIDKAT